MLLYLKGVTIDCIKFYFNNKNFKIREIAFAKRIETLEANKLFLRMKDVELYLLIYCIQIGNTCKANAIVNIIISKSLRRYRT